MQQLTFKQISDAVHGKCEYYGTVDSVCTDTRRLEPNCLYIALKGERFDGHDFITKAFELGAAAVLSERPVEEGPAILVPDTHKALLDLAAYYRSLFSLSLVGITGSVGKTTTKEMIYAVLATKYNTLKTFGNLNNDIGLPLTLLRLDGDHTAAVIEMGMSHFGEISALSKVARPNIGLITNIGYSHIESLGSRENILRAKLELLDGMDAGAPLILNADDDLLVNVQYEIDRDIIYYGISNTYASIRAVNIKPLPQGGGSECDISYYGKKIHCVLPVPGRHNILNALAAFCVGLVCDIVPEDIVQALGSYRPEAMRQNIVQRGGQTLIVDCYNASPQSMDAALSVLSELPGPAGARRIAVLGDMLELGGFAPELHRSIADMAMRCKVDLLVCYGPESAATYDRAVELGLTARHFGDREALARFLQAHLREGDIVLFKASRGMRLEEIIDDVYKKLGS